MFNRGQREELNALSSKLFGATSRWQKMLKNKSYWVPTGETDKVEHKNYLRGKGGTLTSVRTAERKGLLKEGEHPETYETERQILREPNFDELRQTLEYMLDSKMIGVLMSKSEPEDVRFVYAYRFVKDELRYSFGLQKTVKVDKEDSQDPVEAQKAMIAAQEEYEKDLNSLLDTIGDEKIVDRIKDAVVEPKEFAKIGGFEAADFVADVVFCMKNAEIAEEQYLDVIERAEALL